MVPISALWMPILLSAVIVFVARFDPAYGASLPQKRLPQAAGGRSSG